MEQIKVWKVEIEDGTFYYESSPACIAEMLAEMTPEHPFKSKNYFKISCREMSRDEYDNLPEFTGF